MKGKVGERKCQVTKRGFVVSSVLHSTLVQVKNILRLKLSCINRVDEQN